MFQEKPRIQDIFRADESVELSIKEAPSNPIRESREKAEAPPSRRKRVTFDTNVITYEHVQVYDSTESLLERNEKGETFPKSKDEDSVVLSTSNYRYGNYIESDDDFEDFELEDYDFTESLLEINEKGETFPKSKDEDSVVLSKSSYRYENCVESDDEFEHEDYDFDEDDYDHDLDDDDDDEDEDEEVLIRSMESNRNARFLSVLKPVENLDQWKALKSKGSTRKLLNVNGQAENASAPENQNQETVINTSLSSWMISSEKSKRNNNRVACCYNNNNNEEVLVRSMESNRNARFLSVLKPVENLDQWKALKSKGSTRKPLNVNGQAENASAPKNQNQETVINTSLSSWMISSEKSKRNNYRVACC